MDFLLRMRKRRIFIWSILQFGLAFTAGKPGRPKGPFEVLIWQYKFLTELCLPGQAQFSSKFILPYMGKHNVLKWIFYCACARGGVLFGVFFTISRFWFSFHGRQAWAPKGGLLKSLYGNINFELNCACPGKHSSVQTLYCLIWAKTVQLDCAIGYCSIAIAQYSVWRALINSVEEEGGEEGGEEEEKKKEKLLSLRLFVAVPLSLLVLDLSACQH